MYPRTHAASGVVLQIFQLLAVDYGADPVDQRCDYAVGRGGYGNIVKAQSLSNPGAILLVAADAAHGFGEHEVETPARSLGEKPNDSGAAVERRAARGGILIDRNYGMALVLGILFAERDLIWVRTARLNGAIIRSIPGSGASTSRRAAITAMRKHRTSSANGRPTELGGPHAERRRRSVEYWKKPYRWAKEASETGTPVRVFCASLADVFDNKATKGSREDLFRLIRATPELIWQLLTKRPQNIAALAHTRAVLEAWRAD
jgi:hypothetical protein